MDLRDYFSRISIIHLPERTDRFKSITTELRGLGLLPGDARVSIPPAPRPADANGFPSRGVYGNFLSHLGILKSALDEGLETVWVLEDDAIFSRCLLRSEGKIASYLKEHQWDLCYFGHSADLSEQKTGFVRLPAEKGFRWAHCYAAHARVLPRLVSYLQRAVNLPAGHPEGGKLYIDGAFTLFRRFNPDVVALAANPALSIQKGCPSSLAGGHWYDRVAAVAPFVSLARRSRDHWWRLSSGDPASFLPERNM
jgi:glycosyl transferase, family 25